MRDGSYNQANDASVAQAISASGLSIYDPLDTRPELYIASDLLEELLDDGLRGLNLDFPLRTRAKVVKQSVCDVLGYPVPPRFERTQPRFPGQNFDVYVQKADNLQIWNEEVSASRRYVLARVDAANVVTCVRVILGDALAAWDRTGTLTHKYQAKSAEDITSSVLVSSNDTRNVTDRLIGGSDRSRPAGSSRTPRPETFVPISTVHACLLSLIGTTVVDPGLDQERNRGGALHQMVCSCVCGESLADSGQFPDIPEQLIEVKLQTASTIDLGLVCPDSTDSLPEMPQFQHQDVRYAVFYGTAMGGEVRLDHVVLSTGEAFFTFFRRFAGLVRNAKLQIPLPKNLFLP